MQSQFAASQAKSKYLRVNVLGKRKCVLRKIKNKTLYINVSPTAFFVTVCSLICNEQN